MSKEDAHTPATSHPVATKVPITKVILIASAIVILVLPLLMAFFIRTNGGPGEKETTKVILRAVIGAITEFEVSENRKVDHRAVARPLSMNSGKHNGTAIPDSSIEYIVAELWANERCRKALQSLGKAALADTDGNGFLEVLDGWGNPLIYVESVSHSDTFRYDDFLAECDRPCLISAGPDGSFGDVRVAGSRWIQDNIYSLSLD